MGEERDSGYGPAGPNSDERTLFDGAAPYVHPVGDAPVVEVRSVDKDSPGQGRFVFEGTELETNRNYTP